MPSVANHSIVDRDHALTGLEVLLDEQATSRAIRACGVAFEGTVQTEYLRYKPGRRCISMVRVGLTSGELRFVLTAFPELVFEKQRSKTTAELSSGRCWQDASHRIRIDQFPFDPGLRHIEKCFAQSSRRRLLRRTLGQESHYDQFYMESLAYKPSRRYVASGSMLNSASCTHAEPHNTFKFYSGAQFGQTLRRLQTVQSVDISPPRIIANNEHYRIISLEWVAGRPLADLVENGAEDESLLIEVGRQLARLHTSLAPQHAGQAADTHELSELAEYIGFLSPNLVTLANQAVEETQSKLAITRELRTMIHGDFYAKQVLVDEGKVRFIDFDQTGVGNPYQDVGNFVAKLYWQSINLGKGQSLVEQYAETFLRGYRSQFTGFDENAYRAHLAAGLIRCATHPFRRAKNDWQCATRQLLKLSRRALRPSTLLRGSDATCWEHA